MNLTLDTRFSRRFGLHTPIALAPMALASGGALAAACANAGAGQNVEPVASGVVTMPRTVFDQCQGVPEWQAEFTAFQIRDPEGNCVEVYCKNE